MLRHWTWQNALLVEYDVYNTIILAVQQNHHGRSTRPTLGSTLTGRHDVEMLYSAICDGHVAHVPGIDLGQSEARIMVPGPFLVTTESAEWQPVCLQTRGDGNDPYD